MIRDADATTAEHVGEPVTQGIGRAFFAVSDRKFWVLSLFSFGAYAIYWFYQNWKIVRDEHGEKVSPIARTILGIFYCYALFKRMSSSGQAAQMPALAAGTYAMAWIATNGIGSLPDPFWVVSALAFVWVVPVQQYVNRLNAIVAPGRPTNARFTGWNKTLIGVGALWWVLVIVGLCLPEVPPDEPAPRSNAPKTVQAPAAREPVVIGPGVGALARTLGGTL